MNKEVKYISYYDTADSPVRRNYVTSASSKMESICEAINECGYDVKIISMSEVTEDKCKFYKGSTRQVNNHLKVKHFCSWGGKSKILKKIKLLWHLLAMFVYLITHTRKNEPVIVYHSLGYFNVIRWAKSITGFRLILEVEEIYQDVKTPKYNALRKIEYLTFNVADAYIFPTELLNEKLNIHNKPYLVMYGTYTVSPQITPKFNDGQIHVIFAGTFDRRKGCISSILAAQHLTKDYHLHVCGFGSKEDIENVTTTIAKINACSSAEITYEGLKTGNDYIKMVQKCDIGLSTQNPESKFNETSFPSKILSYMTNGLSVVSIKIKAVERASISQNIVFYEHQTPEDIANAIKRTPLTNDNRNVIEKLYINLVNNLQKLL